jgi:NAD(P)-dependent dehydrogenase (short-subunit alcohol dehydrogenase family)
MSVFTGPHHFLCSPFFNFISSSSNLLTKRAPKAWSFFSRLVEWQYKSVSVFCVAKHALESMAEVHRRELMMFGIQAISIQPGPIQSELWDKNLNTLDVYFDTDYGKMAHKANRIIRAAQKMHYLLRLLQL